MGDNKKVPVNESFDYLQKSLNNLNIQQSTTSSVPNLYPKINDNQVNTNQPKGSDHKPDKTD